MNNFKLTSTTLCAIILVIAFFLTWAGIGYQSQSGWSLWQLGISPGMLSYVISGLSRLGAILLVLIPASGALIVWQKSTSTPNPQLTVWVKRAYFIPAIIAIAGIVFSFIKLNATKRALEKELGGFSSLMDGLDTPGLFDVLGLGAYLTLAAAIYLALIGLGKATDKELWKPQATNATSDQKNS